VACNEAVQLHNIAQANAALSQFDEASIRYGRALRQSGRPEKALVYFEKALELLKESEDKKNRLLYLAISTKHTEKTETTKKRHTSTEEP